jgi:hypothetical protein
MPYHGIMGQLQAMTQRVRDLFLPPIVVTALADDTHTFDTSPRPVDQVITAMKYGEYGRVTRAQALSVAAVQRGRNELCSIATLPLRLYRDRDTVDAPLFRQYDPDVPNVVHMSATIEDLAFEGIAWWQVTGQDFDGYPMSVRRIEPSKVSLQPPGRGSSSRTLPILPGYQTPAPLGAGGPTGRQVWIDQGDGKGPQPFPASLMIRFDSPNPGILGANARAIRIAMTLDRLVELYAENPALREYFTDSDDPSVDPMSDQDIDAFLAEYGAMRTQRPYGWLPSSVKRADVQSPSPRDLTLVDLQQQVMVAIANGLGVDPEDIGVSTTSRTYQNEDARRRDKVNRMYAPFMSAITDRLSMGDVTRRGYAAKFDLSDYLKPDPVGQVAYWKGLMDLGVTDAAEVRGWAGLSGPPPSTSRPVPPTSPRRRHATFDSAGALHTFSAGDFGPTPAPTVDVEAQDHHGPGRALQRRGRQGRDQVLVQAWQPGVQRPGAHGPPDGPPDARGLPPVRQGHRGRPHRRAGRPRRPRGQPREGAAGPAPLRRGATASTAACPSAWTSPSTPRWATSSSTPRRTPTTSFGPPGARRAPRTCPHSMTPA